MPPHGSAALLAPISLQNEVSNGMLLGDFLGARPKSENLSAARAGARFSGSEKVPKSMLLGVFFGTFF